MAEGLTSQGRRDFQDRPKRCWAGLLARFGTNLAPSFRSRNVVSRRAANGVLRSGERTPQPFLDDPRGGGFRRKSVGARVSGTNDTRIFFILIFLSSCHYANIKERKRPLSDLRGGLRMPMQKYRERHASDLRPLQQYRLHGSFLSFLGRLLCNVSLLGLETLTCLSTKHHHYTIFSVGWLVVSATSQKVSAAKGLLTRQKIWDRQNAGMESAGRGGVRRRNGGIGAVGGARRRALRTQSGGAPRLVAPFGAASPGDTRRQNGGIGAAGGVIFTTPSAPSPFAPRRSGDNAAWANADCRAGSFRRDRS